MAHSSQQWSMKKQNAYQCQIEKNTQSVRQYLEIIWQNDPMNPHFCPEEPLPSNYQFGCESHLCSSTQLPTMSINCFSVFAPLLTGFQDPLPQASFEILQKCILEFWVISGPMHKLVQEISSKLYWDPWSGWVRWSPQWQVPHVWLVHFHYVQGKPGLPTLLPHLNRQNSVDTVKEINIVNPGRMSAKENKLYIYI